MEQNLNALHLHVENMVSEKGVLVNEQDVIILIYFTFEQLHAFSYNWALKNFIVHVVEFDALFFWRSIFSRITSIPRWLDALLLTILPITVAGKVHADPWESKTSLQGNRCSQQKLHIVVVALMRKTGQQTVRIRGS